jgi:predicted PurR-regulated permease PerM
MHRTRGLGSPSPRAVVAIGAALLLLAVLYLGRGALGPFIVGALVVYVLDPAVGWLTRRRTPRWLAIPVAAPPAPRPLEA